MESRKIDLEDSSSSQSEAEEMQDVFMGSSLLTKTIKKKKGLSRADYVMMKK